MPRTPNGVPGAELVAVAAAREGRAEEVGRRLGVAHGSYSELFARDDVDAVVLAARSVDHGPLAVEVLRSGKHLFLEKPGATSLAEHDTLRLESAARPGQVVQVGYMRRYDAGFVEAHRRVQAGDGGNPLVILLTSRDTEWPDGEDPRDTGGFLLDMASHDYDAACWLFDDEPVEVSVARQALVYPVLTRLGDLDNGVVTIRFARGGIAVTHVSRTSSFGHDIRCEVVGSEGSVFVRGPGDGTAALIDRSDAARFPARLSRALRRRLRRRAHRVRGGLQRGGACRSDARRRPAGGCNRHRGTRKRRGRTAARGRDGLAWP